MFNIERTHFFYTVLGLLALSLLLCVFRAQSGTTLGIELGPQGYVVDIGEDLRVLGDNREVVEPGDRVLTLAGREVGSLAEIGDVLRSLSATGESDEPLTVPLTMERYNYRFGESLNYKEVQERGFPSSLEDDDRVVGYDAHEVRGDIDRPTILAILANRPGQRVTFYFERPLHRYHVELPLQDPPLRGWPIVVFSVALLLCAVITWRVKARSAEPDDVAGERLARAMFPLAMVTLTAPWLLLLLNDTALVLGDPLILFPALMGLAFFRPTSLELHRRLFSGSESTIVTVALLLPGAVVAFVGMLLVAELAPSLWGGTIESGKELDIITLVRTGVGLIGLYQVFDLFLWVRNTTRTRRDGSMVLTAPQLGLLISSLALVSAALFWIKDPTAFIQGGFVYHAAGLALALTLGDLAMVAIPPLVGPVAGLRRGGVNPATASTAICDLLLDDAGEMGLYAPELVVVRGRFAVVLSCARDFEGVDEDDLNPEDVPVTLTVSRATEEVRAGVGLLRDEEIFLPLKPGHETGREEHVGEFSGATDVVRSVADNLGVGTAFILIDEADTLDAPSHAERDQAFYTYLLDYGAPNHDLDIERLTRIRKRFEALWPSVRQLILESLLREAISGTTPIQKKASGNGAEAELIASLQATEPVAPTPSAHARTVLRTEYVDRWPADYTYMQRDLELAYPLDEEELLEEELEELLEAMAEDDAPLVIVGPPSIGKEFVARRLHGLRFGDDGPFIKFPVSICPPSMRSFELFGEGDEPGHIQAAEGGTLYIDDAVELGETLLDRLLIEIGERDVWLAFSIRSDPSAPTRVALDALDGALGRVCRSLLAHRVVLLEPLRDRPAMVRSLSEFYLLTYAMKHNKVIPNLAAPAMAHLLGRRWLGGVRELQNAIEVAVLRCEGEGELTAAHFLDAAATKDENPAPAPKASERISLTDDTDGDAEQTTTRAPASPEDLTDRVKQSTNLKALLAEVRTLIFKEALEREEGNKTAAARRLGVKRNVFVKGLKD